MQINRSATPWFRKTPPGIHRGTFTDIEQSRQAYIDREIRMRLLIQSACYLGIPVSRHDLETRLVRN